MSSVCLSRVGYGTSVTNNSHCVLQGCVSIFQMLNSSMVDICLAIYIFMANIKSFLNYLEVLEVQWTSSWNPFIKIHWFEFKSFIPLTLYYRKAVLSRLWLQNIYIGKSVEQVGILLLSFQIMMAANKDSI